MQRRLTRALAIAAGAFGAVAVAAALTAAAWGSGSSTGSFQPFGCRMLGFTCAPQHAGPSPQSAVPYALGGPTAAPRPSDHAAPSPSGAVSPGPVSPGPVSPGAPSPGAVSLDDVAAHVGGEPADSAVPAAPADSSTPAAPAAPADSSTPAAPGPPWSHRSSPPGPSKQPGAATEPDRPAYGLARRSPPATPRPPSSPPPSSLGPSSLGPSSLGPPSPPPSVRGPLPRRGPPPPPYPPAAR